MPPRRQKQKVAPPSPDFVDLESDSLSASINIRPKTSVLGSESTEESANNKANLLVSSSTAATRQPACGPTEAPTSVAAATFGLTTTPASIPPGPVPPTSVPLASVPLVGATAPRASGGATLPAIVPPTATPSASRAATRLATLAATVPPTIRATLPPRVVAPTITASQNRTTSAPISSTYPPGTTTQQHQSGSESTSTTQLLKRKLVYTKESDSDEDSDGLNLDRLFAHNPSRSIVTQTSAAQTSAIEKSTAQKPATQREFAAWNQNSLVQTGDEETYDIVIGVVHRHIYKRFLFRMAWGVSYGAVLKGKLRKLYALEFDQAVRDIFTFQPCNKPFYDVAGLASISTDHIISHITNLIEKNPASHMTKLFLHGQEFLTCTVRSIYPQAWEHIPPEPDFLPHASKETRPFVPAFERPQEPFLATQWAAFFFIDLHIFSAVKAPEQRQRRSTCSHLSDIPDNTDLDGNMEFLRREWVPIWPDANTHDITNFLCAHLGLDAAAARLCDWGNDRYGHDAKINYKEWRSIGSAGMLYYTPLKLLVVSEPKASPLTPTVLVS